MPYSTYRPEFMGSATLEPEGEFDAGSWQSFTLVYEAGRFGIDDTGSIKIGMRFATDFGPVQFDDPAAPGYTTIEASNGAELDYRWEFKRNIRPWSRSLYIGVKKHFLSEGDKITIRFGDPRWGSKGVRLQTYCETEFEFRVFADPIATYDYVALPESPKIKIVPGDPVTWRSALPTLRRVGEEFRLAVKSDDAWGNPSNRIDENLVLRANMPVAGLPSESRFPAGQFSHFVENLSCESPGDLVIRVERSDGSLLCQTNPLRIVEKATDVHYWADLHGQSNETLGTNTAREYFEFGRDRAFLDACAHQGNDFQITTEFWEELNALTAELDRPGKFVCIPGYEWSANTSVGGDRNVFFRHENGPIIRSSHAQIPDLSDEDRDAHNAHQLFEKLTGEDCVCWAHCGGRYADIQYAHDGRLEKSIEVHSSWGTFEWLLQDAFEKDYRIGVVANSDGHKGRVGASYPGASFFGSYGGLTCFIAPELDRDGIFKAMRRRHHFGTTGTRLYIDIEAQFESESSIFENDPKLGPSEKIPSKSAIMGDIVQTQDDSFLLNIDVNGSGPLERLDIFDGPDLIETQRNYSDDDLGSRIRLVFQGAEYRGRARTTTWDGTLRIEGNSITDVQMFNNWNLDRGIRDSDEQSVSWKAVTAGNFCGLDIWLKDRNPGRIFIDTPCVKTEIDISEIGFDDLRFDGGGLDRAIRIFRLPDELSDTRMNLTKEFAVRPDGDTRPYIRVTQIDGHRAWTTPLYIFQ